MQNSTCFKAFSNEVERNFDIDQTNESIQGGDKLEADFL